MDVRSRQEKIIHWRNLVSFWIFGLSNNFAYVVMLSAAHDILEEEKKSQNNSTSNATTPTTTENPDDTYLQCNPTSTGAILLADVLPTLIIKIVLPFFLQKIHYHVKIALISGFGVCSFFVVAFAHKIWLSILGVVFASIGAGLGEITFLSLTTLYHKNVVSMWSSGTGGAGVAGALIYAAFLSLGLSPRTSLLIMITIPALMVVTYTFILTKPLFDVKKDDDVERVGLLLEEDSPKKNELTLGQKLRIIPSLLKYMLPLSLVYFAEYFINQGLHELLYFNGLWLSKGEQYRWFQVDYQIGVFISRSSVNIVHIKKLWLLPILQFGNMALLLCQVFFRFIPNIWIIFVIILWEGLLGGAAYVNTFYRMTNEVPKEQKEYSMGIATVGDSMGISIAGAVAIPVHQSICDLRIRM